MPKVARKVAIPRNVPSAGAFIGTERYWNHPFRCALCAHGWHKAHRKRGRRLSWLAKAAIARESCPPCQASGDCPGGLADQASLWDPLGVGRRDRVWMTWIGGVVARHDQRRDLESLQILRALANGCERGTWRSAATIGIEVAMAQHPLAGEAQDRVAPGRVDSSGGGRCRRRSRRRRSRSSAARQAVPVAERSRDRQPP